MRGRRRERAARVSRATAPLTGLLLLLLLGAARAQEPAPGAPPPQGPLDLRPRWSAGERCEGEARLLLTLKVRLKLEGDPQRPLDRTSEQAQGLLRRWQDEVVEVADERPVQTRRRYSEDYQGTREPGARKMEREDAPLHQRKLLLDRDEQQRPRARVIGEPAVAAELLAQERAGERYEAILPAEPVALGASWTVTDERVSEALGGGLGKGAQGKITCTLRAIDEEPLDKQTPAEPLALIDLVVTASGKQGEEEDAPQIETELSGTLRFSLARHKVVAVELAGTAHLTQVRRDGAITLTLDGKGPLELKKRYWFPERPKKGETSPADEDEGGIEPPRPRGAEDPAAPPGSETPPEAPPKQPPSRDPVPR